MAVRRRPVNNNVETDNEAPETEPTQERSASRSIRSKAVGSGWGNSSSQSTRKTEKAPFLDLRNGRRLIKFLDEEPVVRFSRHWIQGKGYSNCPVSLGTEDSCPLCDKDHRPGQAFLMNVLDLTANPNNAGEYEVHTYTFGTEVKNKLISFLQDPTGRYPSLNDEKWYWEIYQSTDGNTGRKTTNVMPIKARDVQDDFGIEPLTEYEIEAASKRYDETSVFSPFLDKLEELARNL
ncbi:hypothetical protein HWB05_gp086 [Streptomyces phage BRock]|uniref:Single-stranded DNA-binding protein n=1 Tax=Streptomyces phage BRock TaxID=1913591 RepID=A0A1J0GVZ4_9CAUD|nr:hypothetical protein HWB05_gp086 [Streptomyces phage BRock]APC46348.1 hypothetical protein [Streptomyces phage BRock]